ncbi:hypothetical protein C8R44DRAFT_653139, partial [Mycena epipterygia]
MIQATVPSAFPEGATLRDIQDARSASVALKAASAANGSSPNSAATPALTAAATAHILPRQTQSWTSYNFRQFPPHLTATATNTVPAASMSQTGNGGNTAAWATYHGNVAGTPDGGGGGAGNPSVNGGGGPSNGGGPPSGGNGGGDPPGGGGPPSGSWGGGPPGGGGPPPGGNEGGGPPDGRGPPFEGRNGNFDWQLNHKLNFQMVPEWDRHGKTAIPYICKIAELVRLSPQMVVDLGAIAPLKFTGRAEMWWRSQTTTVRNYLGQSWEYLLRAIQAHFLNANWLQERRREWEEMRFRQRGHENKFPLDFLQRHIVYQMFLYPDEEDGINVVDRLLQTAPDVWAGTINSERYPDIFSLMAAVRRYCATLMGAWTTAQCLGTLSSYYPRCSSRNANVVDATEEPDGDSNSDEPSHPAESLKTANISTAFQPRSDNHSRPPNNGKPRASSSKMNWPEGKTIKGYEFGKRDDVHSEHAPANRVCYICSSARHFVWDCPHYGKWLSMRDANMLEVDVPFDVEEKDYHEYIAMVAEIYNTTSSAYLSEPIKSSRSVPTREALIVDSRKTGALAAHLPWYRDNRNARRSKALESMRTKKGKETEQFEASKEVVVPRKITCFKNKHTLRAPKVISEETRPSETPVPDDEPLPLDHRFQSSLGEHRSIKKAIRKRSHPPGFASLGVRALHLKVAVGSPEALPIKGRLDSGADITLMSEEFFNSIPGLAKPREGIRMRLYALTREAKVLGFTRFPMFALASDGVLISFEVEAYVVKNMRVPLLLGEDFQ